MVGVAVPTVLAILSLGVALECGHAHSEKGKGDGWMVGAIFAGIAFGVLAMIASFAAWHFSALS